MERAYENLKAQERQLEESLSHISEEVKGAALSEHPGCSDSEKLPVSF